MSIKWQKRVGVIFSPLLPWGGTHVSYDTDTEDLESAAFQMPRER